MLSPSPIPILLLALAGVACAGPGEFLRRPTARVGWPPGDAPRIEVIQAYHGTEDVARHPGFWTGLVELVAGADRQHLVAPAGMAMGPDDVLWIADPGRGAVHRLSLRSGEHQVVTGSASVSLRTPIGIAVVPDGRVFVTDSTTAQVVVLGPEGDCRTAFGGAEWFGRPTGIAYDAQRERLVIADTTRCVLAVHGLDGRRLAIAGRRGDAPGEFNYPTHLAIARDGRVFVTDSMNFRVQVLTPELTPISTFGMAGRGPGTFASPKGIALDSEDHVYVVDALFDNVQIFDPTGQLLLAFGSSGREFGQLSLPSGVFISSDDRVLVADVGNARIQFFQYRRRSS